MEKNDLYKFIREHSLAVLATQGGDGTPQSALINIAVSPALEIIFETTSATRKFGNLQARPRVSLVVGWDDERTLQYEGVADQPMGKAFDEAKSLFLSAFPQKAAHEFWPGNDYFRIRPRWIRFSNYYQPRKIEEFTFPFDDLGRGSVPPGLWGRLVKTLSKAQR